MTHKDNEQYKYPHILFIVVDTLREDYANRIMKKELNSLGFVSYDNVISPAPWTTPAHASIMTGFYPAVHGAHETKYKKLHDVKLRMSNYLCNNLKKLGYKTILLSANPLVTPDYGFKGFDIFIPASWLSIPSKAIMTSKERKIWNKIKSSSNSWRGLVKKIIKYRKQKLALKALFNSIYWKTYRYVIRKWPREKGITDLSHALKLILKSQKPLFIFMNVMEVHDPYFIRDPLAYNGVELNLKIGYLNNRAVMMWRKGYLRQVRVVTKHIVKIMNYIKNLKLFDDMLIIITSDHGQLLGEHGRIWHGTFLYDELLRVPLFIKYPKCVRLIKRKERKDEYASLVRLKNFIIKISKKNEADEKLLYSDTVFAESYGTQIRLNSEGSVRVLKNINNLEQYRIAVYYKNYKAIFNVSKWEFESLYSIDHSHINDGVIKQLKSKIVKFLKLKIIFRHFK